MTGFFCRTDPCLNGGSCQAALGSFSCSCAPGFTGPRCAQDVDECLSSPCGPGTCTDHVASFTCTCPPGFRGFRCEQDMPDCSPRYGLLASEGPWHPPLHSVFRTGELRLGEVPAGSHLSVHDLEARVGVGQG